jgi:hypothetical protein
MPQSLYGFFLRLATIFLLLKVAIRAAIIPEDNVGSPYVRSDRISE